VTSLLGTLALALGLVSSLVAAVAWVRAARLGGPPPRRLTHVPLLAAALACGTLEYALLTHDFSVRYVAEQGSRSTPLYETVTSLWAGLEGSLLLWLLVLTGFASAAARRPRPGAPALHRWAVAVLAALSAAFFAVALAGGNAFARVAPVPTDGPGPNPLLQEAPLMGVHPPLLYVGYVGLAVPFAYAVAALVTGETGTAWLRAVRSWTLVAWTALTAGIVLGAWWSYAVLGWGGYWAWDPVENASLLPWLTATALLHALLVQQRRQALQAWTLSLATASFLLVVVGTFLTRSGIVESVHSFSASPIGPLLLALLAVLVVVVLGLFAWRADRLGPPRTVGAPLSRESALVVNNALLVALAAVVLLGTLFPVAVEALRGDRVSVGAPYFDRFAVPTALVLLLLMALGPVVRWGADDARALAQRTVLPALAASLAALGSALAGLPLTAVLACGLATLVVAVAAGRAAELARSAQPGVRPRVRALARRRRVLGGLVVHCGFALGAVAVALSSALTTTLEQRLEVGERAAVGGWAVRLEGIDRARDDDRMTTSALLSLTRDGVAAGELRPRLSFWSQRSMVVGTPAVRSSAAGDVYATVTAVGDDASWGLVRLSVHPAVPWLWVAGGVMALGGLLAAWPARRPGAGAGPRPLAADLAREEPAGVVTAR
jgi:cytochrome c-type biogenesis protein CcmF